MGCSTTEPNPGNCAWSLPETLLMLAMSGDTEVVADIIALFKMDTARRLALLRDALEKSDAVRITAQAHAIKGSAIQVGADSLAALCRRIELEGRTLPIDQIHPLVRQAECEFERLRHIDFKV